MVPWYLLDTPERNEEEGGGKWVGEGGECSIVMEGESKKERS